MACVKSTFRTAALESVGDGLFIWCVSVQEAYGDMFHNLTKYQVDTFKLVGQWSKFVHSRRTDKYE